MSYICTFVFDPEELYSILNCYLKAFIFGFFKPNEIDDKLVVSTVFRAIFSFGQKLERR